MIPEGILPTPPDTASTSDEEKVLNYKKSYWPKEVREQALKLYKAHWSTTEVSRILGVPVGTIQGWRRAAGISRTHAESMENVPSRTPDERIEIMRAMYEEEGMSLAAIGERLEIHATTVKHHLRRNGIELRGRAESQRLSYRQGRKTPPAIILQRRLEENNKKDDNKNDE